MLMVATFTHWARWGRSHSGLFLISMAIFAGYGCDLGFVDVGSDVLKEVRGQVYLDDQPVADARIVFVPSYAGLDRNARLSYGTTNADGEFNLRQADNQIGAFPGLNRVIISKADFKQAASVINIDQEDVAGNALKAQIGLDSIAKHPVMEVSEQIPFFYNSQSDLTCELISGQGIQQVRFDLVSIDPLLKKQCKPELK